MPVHPKPSANKDPEEGSAELIAIAGRNSATKGDEEEAGGRREQQNARAPRHSCLQRRHTSEKKSERECDAEHENNNVQAGWFGHGRVEQRGRRDYDEQQETRLKK
jgi:hypothetical protein